MPPPSKRRRVEAVSAVEEITFDLAARQEYLTGFHKRKVQRAKAAQEAAERRAREERIRDRAQLREKRKAELARHVEEVNALLRPLQHAGGLTSDSDSDGDSDEEWEGLEDGEPPPIDHEAEYVDEDKYTTVTVEVVDVNRDGLFAESKQKTEVAEGTEPRVEGQASQGKDEKKEKRKWTKDNPNKAKMKKKKRNFRYESKAERKVARTKERTKNSKQARERRSK